jgi:hypothetical protein
MERTFYQRFAPRAIQVRNVRFIFFHFNDLERKVVAAKPLIPGLFQDRSRRKLSVENSVPHFCKAIFESPKNSRARVLGVGKIRLQREIHINGGAVPKLINKIQGIATLEGQLIARACF